MQAGQNSAFHIKRHGTPVYRTGDSIYIPAQGFREARAFLCFFYFVQFSAFSAFGMNMPGTSLAGAAVFPCTARRNGHAGPVLLLIVICAQACSSSFACYRLYAEQTRASAGCASFASLLFCAALHILTPLRREPAFSAPAPIMNKAVKRHGTRQLSLPGPMSPAGRKRS